MSDTPRYHVPERLHADRGAPVVVHADALAWTPSPTAGIERRFLEREGAEVARATSLVRYAPKSVFPPHVHEKGEEFLVLEGVFSDQDGDFPAGTYVRNPPGSRHAPFTHGGCVIFVKLRQMLPDERDTIARATHDVVPTPTDVQGLARIPLFSDAGREAVCIEQLDAGTHWTQRRAEGGEEILVLEGELQYGEHVCGPMTWLRMPAAHIQSMSTSPGCRLWVKRGHLSA